MLRMLVWKIIVLHKPPSHPQALERKAKVDRWDYTKVKNCCPAKETFGRVNRQPSEWKETFHKGLRSRKYSDYKTSNE
jgi:hypothetical protein